MLEPLSVLGSLGTLVETLIKGYQKARKGKVSTMRAVLTEMRLNMERMEDHFEMQQDIHQVIRSLQVEALKSALFDSDFNFDHFQHRSVQPHKLIDQPESFYLNYQGWSSERLFNNIYEKIVRLQEINETFSDDPRYNLPVRLGNIRKLITLLFLHLRNTKAKQ